jgi:hypothetical protein
MISITSAVRSRPGRSRSHRPGNARCLRRDRRPDASATSRSTASCSELTSRSARMPVPVRRAPRPAVSRPASEVGASPGHDLKVEPAPARLADRSGHDAFGRSEIFYRHVVGSPLVLRATTTGAPCLREVDHRDRGRAHPDALEEVEWRSEIVGDDGLDDVGVGDDAIVCFGGPARRSTAPPHGVGRRPGSRRSGNVIRDGSGLDGPPRLERVEALEVRPDQSP